MQIGQPEWYLSGQRCPEKDCNGQLIFSSCRACAGVLLICDEVFLHVFPNPRNLAEIVEWHWHDTPCPFCNNAQSGEFSNATSDQIQALGFKVGEYE